MLPRPAESTFLKMRGVVGRVCAAWVTARAAAVGDRSRLAVWRTQTVSGASGLGVSKTRAVWPVAEEGGGAVAGSGEVVGEDEDLGA